MKISYEIPLKDYTYLLPEILKVDTANYFEYQPNALYSSSDDDYSAGYKAYIDVFDKFKVIALEYLNYSNYRYARPSSMVSGKYVGLITRSLEDPNNYFKRLIDGLSYRRILLSQSEKKKFMNPMCISSFEALSDEEIQQFVETYNKLNNRNDLRFLPPDQVCNTFFMP